MMNQAKEKLLMLSKAIGRFCKNHRIAATIVSLILVLSMLMSVITVSIREVAVFDGNEQTHSYYAISYDQDSILEKTGLTLHEKDEMKISEQGGKITAKIIRAFPVTILADGKTYQVMTTGASVGALLQEAGLTLGEQDQISKELTASVTASEELTIKRVAMKTITETAEIPYETITKKSNSLYKGQSKVEKKGVAGEKKLTYQVTYTDGIETGRKLIETEILKEAEDRVVVEGTKIRSSFKKTSSTPKTYKKAIAMEATAYVQGGTTASGRPARVGVVAVDPRVIPLGTKVYVETADGKFIYGTAIAADTGGAIKGNKIDICVASREEAYRFGRRIVNVYILG